MAGAGFRVEPATLLAGASSMDAAADAVRAAARALSGALAGTGGMAGDDKVGRSFSHDYDPAADGIVQGVATLADGMADFAEALRATEANYSGSDASSVIRQGG